MKSIENQSSHKEHKRKSLNIIPAAILLATLNSWCSKNPEAVSIEIEQTKIEMEQQINMRRKDAIRYQELKQDTDTLPSSNPTKSRKLIEEWHLLEDIKIYNENIEKLDKKIHDLKHENARNNQYWWDSFSPEYYDFLLS